MSIGKPDGPGLAAELQDAYDTHRRFSFIPDPPDRPLAEHWRVKGERGARIFLGMPTLPVALFRVRDFLLRRSVPLLPYFCEMVSAAVWNVSIGRQVKISTGLIMPHGRVVIDGKVDVGRNCIINPWVTVGLTNSKRVGFSQDGPLIGDDVSIGTGAKVLGPIVIGDRARIGANAVVVDDVPAGATFVGAPARPVRTAAGRSEALTDLPSHRTRSQEDRQ